MLGIGRRHDRQCSLGAEFVAVAMRIGLIHRRKIIERHDCWHLPADCLSAHTAILVTGGPGRERRR
ncbi:hypothetical protein GCM10010112_81290 [Actinoplanes lobatus]|nr:hypothetical protein GCM10010112_81290 [Actinoplanes lobatus]